MGFGKEVRDPADAVNRYIFSRKRADREACLIALPFSPASHLPAFLKHNQRVLLEVF